MKVVGSFERSENYGFVVPDNKKFGTDIFIAKENMGNALNGQKVVAEIPDNKERPEHKSPEGKIVEILGFPEEPGMDMLSVIKSYELPVEFSEKELHQAERASKPVSEADCLGRMDLRDMLMVTIDGEDARDLDDAVSLSVRNGIYELGVHIADVSNYVQEYSALDREALKRGTSVYLPDRVIPMLPPALSNGICSLNEGEDRLALSCLMQVDEKGNVADYQIAESVIRVNRRMTYTGVQKILDEYGVPEKAKAVCPAQGVSVFDKEETADNGELTEPPCHKENTAEQELIKMLLKMEELSVMLRSKRQKRGSIDFDFPESKLLLDEEGHPLEVKPYERTAATNLIEEFMLLANETVAQHFYWLDIPFVYRTHESPEPEKIKKLAFLIRNMGFGMKVGQEEIHPKEIQKLLCQVEDSGAEALVSRLALRSMKRASYTVDCIGHFGLACQYYTHFTSPIRRYPDLQIHRIIKQQLRGKLSEEKQEHYRSILEGVTKQCSELERRADEVERECEKIKKAEYMEDHVGERFSGVISGVSSWGIYVELENTVEGMIGVMDLPKDFYHYDESRYTLTGEHTGRTFSLGQSVEICVKKADKIMKYIDFVLAEEAETEA